MLVDIERRLHEILTKLTGVIPGYNKAEIIPLTPDALAESLTQRRMEEPTDNLILTIILHHARLNVSEEKILLSANSKHFDVPDVRTPLASVGIVEYFSRAQDFLGWLRSRSSSDAAN